VPKKTVIAIVDDDESLREAIESLLKALGFAAETFGCAEEFLASGRPRHTACLIADVNMPGMTGLALHDHLDASGARIPTVLITAYPDQRTRARAQEAGLAGYLVKPFSEAALLTCVQAALAEKPRKTAARAVRNRDSGKP
jgi:FixJ family two-component response regulator